MKLRPGQVSSRVIRATRRQGFVALVAIVLGAGATSVATADLPAGRPAAAGQPGLYWIYWGSGWEDQAAKAAAAGERPFGIRAEARLRRAGAVLSTLVPANRPVPYAFLDHLRSLGVEVRFASRFLRAASAFLAAGDLVRLGSDPGVVALVPVLTLRRPTEGGPDPSHDGAEAERDADRRSGGGPVEAPDGGARAGLWRPASAATDTLPDPRNLTREDYGASWRQCEQLGVTALHRLGYSGRGVLVCLLDAGFYPWHEAFTRSRVLATWDFVEHDQSVWYDSDRIGSRYNTPAMEYHGTYTFSALGGFSAGALIGPAYRAQFALGRTEVVESETRMEEDTYVAGLEWADSLGADIVSTSLGYLRFNDGFAYSPDSLDGRTAVTSRAAALLVRRGVVLVTAMGNAGPQPRTLITPADAESVIAVGAVDSRGDVAGFSSRGPNALGVTKPDVCACGVATACADAAAREAYTSKNGTSLATPLIAGLVALLLEAHPDWTPHQVQQALHRSGDQTRNPDDARGWGVPDASFAFGAIDPTASESSQLTVRSVSWVEEEESGEAALRDSLASPGQHGRLRLVLMNEGDHPAPAAWLALAVPPEGIVADGDSLLVNSLEPGAVVRLEDGPTLAVADDHPVPQLARLPLRFRTDRGVVYYRTLNLPIVAPTWQVRPYPNPLVGSRELMLDLEQPHSGPISLTVFDVAGRLVARPFVALPSASRVRLHWTPEVALTSGVYYLRIETGGGATTRRFVLLR
jgi:subtilisin family serine protease